MQSPSEQKIGDIIREDERIVSILLPMEHGKLYGLEHGASISTLLNHNSIDQWVDDFRDNIHSVCKEWKRQPLVIPIQTYNSSMVPNAHHTRRLISWCDVVAAIHPTDSVFNFLGDEAMKKNPGMRVIVVSARDEVDGLLNVVRQMPTAEVPTIDNTTKKIPRVYMLPLENTNIMKPTVERALFHKQLLS